MIRSLRDVHGGTQGGRSRRLGRLLGPMLFLGVLTGVLLVWVQVLTAGVAFGRVRPGLAPYGWTITAIGGGLGAVMATAGGLATAAVLRRRGESVALSRTLGLVPGAVIAVGQGVLALTAARVPPGTTAATTLALVAGAALGAYAGGSRAAVADDETDETSWHVREPGLIGEEPR